MNLSSFAFGVLVGWVLAGLALFLMLFIHSWLDARQGHDITRSPNDSEGDGPQNGNRYDRLFVDKVNP